MRGGSLPTRESFLVYAATFLVGTAFALSTVAPERGSLEALRQATERQPIAAMPSDPRFDWGFGRDATPRARSQRAILVVVENSEPIPFRTDPQLAGWARSGVSFPLAVRISEDLSADLSAMGSGFGVVESTLSGRREVLDPHISTIRGWQHGALRSTRDLAVHGYSTVPCEFGYAACGGTTVYGALSHSRPLSVDLLKNQIRSAVFDADLVYFEYSASEANTIQLLTAVHDSLAGRGDWKNALIVVAALPEESRDDRTRAPSGSRPFDLFVKFPHDEFAGRSSSLTVSSYDVGNSFRTFFGGSIAMDSLQTMLRNESRHRSRFVFGGERDRGLTWVRAGRFEYDVTRAMVFDVDSDEKRERDISGTAQNFKRQAKRIVELWPTSLDRSLFSGNVRTIEDSWTYPVTPVDPFAGNPTHFIYK